MITLTLEGQNLAVRTPHIVAATVDYLDIQIERFGHEWKELSLHIFFQLGSTTYELLTDGDYIGKSAHLNLTEGRWQVSVVGYEYLDGVMVEKITTNTIGLNVAPPPPDAGSDMPETPPTAIEQIQAIAQSVRDDADAGLFNGRDGTDGAQGPEGPPGTTDYNDLSNKPSINGTTLSGNVTVSGLPSVTALDDGKILMVSSGAWTVTNLPTYNGGVS